MTTVTRSDNTRHTLVFADSLGGERSLSVQASPGRTGAIFNTLVTVRGQPWLIDVRLNREQVEALIAQLQGRSELL